MPAAKQDKYLASLPLLRNQNEEDKQLRISFITALLTRSCFSWGHRRTLQEKCMTKKDFPRAELHKDQQHKAGHGSCNTTCNTLLQ